MEANSEELRIWALLLRVPGLDYQRVAAALARFADLQSLLRADAGELEKLGWPENARRALRFPDWNAVDTDLRWLAGAGRHLLPLTSSFYPPLLAQIAGAPLALYVWGAIESLSQTQLAMVGSRNPTADGLDTAFQFAAYLSRCGLTITSGLAEGIDAASHRGALSAGGSTIAVCGTGLDLIYPERHADLAAQIAARGALVSEFPPGTPVRRSHFPQRNRIISGLSLGTLVVEAARQSGSLITARSAAEQGREVFAIPGSIHSPLTRGCHQLIREGAKLVEAAADILVELRLPFEAASASNGAAVSRSEPPAGDELDKDYEILLDALGFDPIGIDALIERSGLEPDAVASMLLILELRGEVEARPGGRYCRALRRR